MSFNFIIVRKWNWYSTARQIIQTNMCLKFVWFLTFNKHLWYFLIIDSKIVYIFFNVMASGGLYSTIYITVVVYMCIFFVSMLCLYYFGNEMKWVFIQLAICLGIIKNRLHGNGTRTVYIFLRWIWITPLEILFRLIQIFPFEINHNLYLFRN